MVPGRPDGAQVVGGDVLREVEYDSEALGYIRECLSQGGLLSEYLLGLPLTRGRVWSRLPSGVGPEARRDFDSGGITTIAATRSWLVPLIDNYLRAREGRYAVFETLWHRGDPVLSKWTGRYFTHKGCVYRFVPSQCCGREEVIGALEDARSYPLVGILASLPQGEPNIATDAEVSAHTLEELACRTDRLLIGAYDDESVLVWQMG